MTNRFGIYVHIPFCVHKCSYCDFYSFTRYAGSDFETLAARLENELSDASSWLRKEKRFEQRAVSLFFGGGTPSLFPIPLLRRVLQTIGKGFSVGDAAEITLEANPETVTDEFCRELRESTSINRISLGAQSFNAANLSKLERLGSRESILRAAERLKRHGYTDFNLDLIFGIPGQDKDGMLADIESAVQLGPKHISFYNLTLKPAHTLFKELPSDDSSAELYEIGRERLQSEGYLQYEISNFAHPGHESQHNLLYWDGGDFLGVGPSAASRFFWDGRFHHRKQFSDFSKYLLQTAFPQPDFEGSSRDQTILEATFLEMRKNRGVNIPAFRERYGYDLRQAKKFPLFVRGGLLEEEGDCLRLTDRGRLLADSVTRDLVD